MGRTGGRQKRERSSFEIQLKKDILSKKRNDGTPYSEKSVDTFVNNIVKISSSFLGKAEVLVSLKWLEDSKKVINWLNTTNTRQGYPYSLQSKLSIYQSIIIGMNTMGYGEEHLSPYWTERDNLGKEQVVAVHKHHSFNTPTAKNQKAVLEGVSKQDIYDLINKLEQESFNDDSDLINRKKLMIATILQIHTEFPFRNDLADMKVTNENEYKKLVETGEDKLFNWLIMGKKNEYKFVLNKFKTQRKYGMIVGEVENEKTINMLNLWLAKGRQGDYLFSKDEEAPLTRNNISVLLSTETKKYMDHALSTTILAKVFNEALGSYTEMTPEKIKKIHKQAYLRGHAVATRITHYTTRS
tara:strand:+ start:1687 stop:2751 length:1065 start_codon:yes stop_codon:yes gene_type:complete